MTDSTCEAFLKASGVAIIKPIQYIDKWRLDRRGVTSIANTEITKALAFN